MTNQTNPNPPDPQLCAKCGQNYGMHVADCRWMTCRPSTRQVSRSCHKPHKPPLCDIEPIWLGLTNIEAAWRAGDLGYDPFPREACNGCWHLGEACGHCSV